MRSRQCAIEGVKLSKTITESGKVKNRVSLNERMNTEKRVGETEGVCRAAGVSEGVVSSPLSF